VWEVVTDLESHPRWRPSVREFRQVSDGPLEVGSRIREVLEWRGREITLADEVTALEAQRRLGIRGGWKAADFDFELLLEPHGTGTVVTFD
jgi:Polyketide cyclase / dehydrase and lipid transport